MKEMITVFSALLIGIAFCNMRASTEPLITEQFLSEQQRESSFEMYTYDEHPFKNWSEADLKTLLGVSELSLKDTSDIPDDTSNVPESFDSRVQWKECIHPIRNQGKCGSCWAFAASEVLSDRFCIASHGTLNVILSPQDFVSCDYLDRGCHGGILPASWLYLRLFGIVSDECKPYTAGDGHVDKCPWFSWKCPVKDQVYKKYKAKNFYFLPSIGKIKENIFNYGPIESGFMVYNDFISYKSGIYRKGPHAKLLGGHAVKILGWGKEENTEYWIVANSWSEAWGENGFFRIAFRECGIENVITGDPKI